MAAETALAPLVSDKVLEEGEKKWLKHQRVWTLKWPWLGASKPFKGIGCTVCAHNARSGSSFASFEVVGSSLQPTNFKLHQESKAHKAAEKALMEGASLCGEAPPKSDFAAVIAAVWKGDSTASGFASYKFRLMVWCVAEARRNHLRKQIKRAKSIALQQDVRDGQLLVGFTACLEDFSLECGFLGQVNLCQDDLGLNARSLHKASVLVAFKFATSCLGAPQRSLAAEQNAGAVDHEVIQILQDRVELVAADAAADEMMCQKLLASSFYPNVLCRTWDKAHACKRLLQRIWGADQYLQQTANSLVLGDGALIQLVSHSRLFKSRFEAAVEQMTPAHCQRIKNLSSALHRFTSHSVPFRRSVLFFVPLVRVAQYIVDNRGKQTSEAQAARRWLLELDGERALTIAMMADISDEALQLNRFFDSSHWNIAEIMSKVQDFLVRLTWMIEQRGILTTGCTKYMLDTLKTPKTIFVDNVQRILQAPSQQSIDKCIERHVCILELARRAVQSDFPSFETLQLFSIFQLKEQPQNSKMIALCRVLSLDAPQFMSEFRQVHPAAVWHFRNGDDALPWEAWKRAVADAGPSCWQLKEALFRFMAFQPGTSAVERMFGNVHSSSRRWRAETSESRIDDELQVHALARRASGAGPVDAWIQLKHDKLLEESRAVWAANFGPPRDRSSTRLAPSSGYKRERNPDSEASFIKNRRVECWLE
eukprot:Skav227898  [mRNA]  locus=scaffold4087:164838:166961:+ [translate_table: standard]